MVVPGTLSATDQRPSIVGIGASAGGLEAPSLVLRAPPDTGLAFVVVQHLASISAA